MSMTYLTAPETSVDNVTTFGGYNHNLSIADGEFFDMMNMTVDKYPFAATRDKRGKMTFSATGVSGVTFNIVGVAARDYIFVTYTRSDDEGLFFCRYDPDQQIFINSTEIIAQNQHGTDNRNMVEMGAYIVIFPDKVMINTANITDGYYLDVSLLELTGTSGTTLTMTDSSGEALLESGESCYVGPYAPKGSSGTTSDGAKWLDTSGSGAPKLKVYSSESGSWSTVAMYAKLYLATDTDFNEYDAITLSNTNFFYLEDNQKYFVISKVDTDDTGKYILFPANFLTPKPTLSEGLTITRKVPDLTHVIECNNRLWGCWYGKDSNGDNINEIFASKQGDPRNWYYFANTAMDSYYLSMGDDGAFTGAIAYESNPIFFRKDCIHRIYGNYPSNYQLKTLHAPGVNTNCWKSLAVMNDVVYYMAEDGVYAYSGSNPTKISDPLGKTRYTNCVAGTIGHKLYMSPSVSGSTDTVHFCYNDYYQTWHKEDNLDVQFYIPYNNELYALCNKSDGSDYLMALSGSKGDLEADFPFALETGNIGYSSPYRKWINKATLRLKMGLSTRCCVDIQYDSDGNWEHIADLKPTGRTGSIPVPITPRRCDHFAVRLTGVGSLELLGITKFYEEGTDYD